MLNIFNNTKHNTKKICYIAMYHPEKFVPVDTDEDIDYVEPEFSVDLIYSRILKDAKTNGSIGYYQYNNYIHFVRVYVALRRHALIDAKRQKRCQEYCGPIHQQ